jgi:hypothetical protein
MIARFGVLALLVSLSARAAYDVSWDFRGTVPGSWNVQGWTQAQPTEFGLRVSTTRPGYMTRVSQLTDPVQVVAVTIASTRQTEGVLLWHVRGTPPDEKVQLPFVIPASESPARIELNVGYYPQWDPLADEIGLALPAGADVLLTTIHLQGWTQQERLWHAIKSFWTPDSFRPYSINFLWGPLLTTNPVARREMFEFLPPHGKSAVTLFYGALLVAAALSIAGIVRRRDRWRRALPVVFVAAWLLFDLRMGFELLHYAYRDIADHVLPAAEQKMFRTHGAFYAILDEAKPHLMEHPRYALVDDPTSPFYTNLRYATYPSLPIRTDSPADDIGLWFVYNRPDVGVDEAGRLVKVGSGVTVLAASGTIVESYDRYTFLYETRRP